MSPTPSTPSQADPNPSQTAPPSRRSVLRGAAGVGAVGFAAAVGVGAAAGPALAAGNGRAAATSDTPQTTAGTPGAAAGPVVVYLRDAASGELDVFAGTSHAVIRDHQLAARLTSAVRPSAKRG
jgi:hypothetical protein